MATESSGTTTTKKSAKSAEDEALSRNSKFSTYRQATDEDLDNADPILPPGPHVMEELGTPWEDTVNPGFKFDKK